MFYTDVIYVEINVYDKDHYIVEFENFLIYEIYFLCFDLVDNDLEKVSFHYHRFVNAN